MWQPHTNCKAPQEPNKVSFGEGQALNPHETCSCPGGQSAGTDACGTLSVITFGKNQVVNQRERISRPARMVGFLFF